MQTTDRRPQTIDNSHQQRARLCCVGLLLFISCCLSSVVCEAQLNFQHQAGTKLIKGRVSDMQSHGSLPKANIVVVNRKTGMTCNPDGSFTMYVYPTDTLRFSSVGYVPKTIAVADIDSTQQYTLEVLLLHDFIKLQEVTIYPWRDVKEFTDAFVKGEDVARVNVPGIAPPKYSTEVPRPKFTNPVSFLYDRLKKKGAADPEFRP